MDTLLMSKMYGDHSIQLLATEEVDCWNVVLRCDNCQKHQHIHNLDFADENAMLFVDAELQMHAAGSDDGWHDGYGFTTNED